jgi:hypothetical protein
MRRIIHRVRSLTIASDGAGAMWSLALLLRTFQTLFNVEHLTIATVDPIPETRHFWSTIDANCGSERIHDSLKIVEFCFALLRTGSGTEYVKRDSLGEKLPYLAEHGMLKVSDPSMYVSNTSRFPLYSFGLKMLSGMDWLRT